MKKINIKSLAFLGGIILATGCSENSWNDHLDGFEEPPVYSATEIVEYTLTADDYKTIASNSTNKSLASEAGESEVLAAIGTNGYFSSAESARKFLPAFLSNSSFPYFNLNDGSSISVKYNLSTNQPSEVLTINEGVKTYKVTDEEYQAAWGSDEDYISAFAPITPASASLPNILKQQYPGAVSGEYAVVSYKEAESNPVFGNIGDSNTPSVYIDESFAGGQGDFTIENVVLPGNSTYVWSSDTKNGYMKASGYVSSVNYDSDAWLISPEVKISNDANAVLTFDQVYRYFANLATAENEATVNVREKGDNWVTLKVPALPSNNDWTFVSSGDIDLSAYNGKTIQIGFHYTSTAAKAGTWEVKNVKLVDGGTPSKVSVKAPAAAVPTEDKNAIYVYDGSKWTVPGSMLILQPSDYTAMGQTYGNLSNNLPNEVLPTYLSKTLPYASEDAAEIVVYNYYNGGSSKYQAKQFTLTNGEWVVNNGATIDRFSRKDGAWIFNPSVEMVLPYARNTEPTYGYFMAVKDWVFDNVTKKFDPSAIPANGSQPAPPFIDYRNNAEFYSGASAYYGNVDVRASTALNNAPTGYTGYEGLTDEEISELIKKRFATESFPGALSIMHPDVDVIEGMDITYTFTFTSYDGSAKEITAVYNLVGKGKFELESCTWWESGKPE